MKFYEIVSGRPGGEVYHREVYWAKSLDKAQEYEAELDKEASEFDDWLWGPHIHERYGDPAEVLTWNGYEMEPAPEWS